MMLQFRMIYYPEVRCQIDGLYWDGSPQVNVKVGDKSITVPSGSISWSRGKSYAIGEFVMESPQKGFLITFPKGEVIPVVKEDLRYEIVMID